MSRQLYRRGALAQIILIPLMRAFGCNFLSNPFTRLTLAIATMSKSRKFVYILFLNLFIGVFGNLEGPFLFWGPKELSLYKRPALKSLEQDDLLEIYENQAAIVVFNNQDSLPLTSDNFPRLRKLLERKTTLVLPQDFLDVHPEYINNETQVSSSHI